MSQEEKKEQYQSVSDNKVMEETSVVEGEGKGTEFYNFISSLQNPIEVELQLLQRRYKDSFSSSPEGEGANCIRVQFTFSPTDPDFPTGFAPKEGIRLAVLLVPGYPTQVPFYMQIDNSDSEISRDVKNVILEASRRFTSTQVGAPMLARYIKWLDRNLLALIQLGREQEVLRQQGLLSSSKTQSNIGARKSSDQQQKSASEKFQVGRKDSNTSPLVRAAQSLAVRPLGTQTSSQIQASGSRKKSQGEIKATNVVSFSPAQSSQLPQASLGAGRATSSSSTTTSLKGKTGASSTSSKSSSAKGSAQNGSGSSENLEVSLDMVNWTLFEPDPEFPNQSPTLGPRQRISTSATANSRREREGRWNAEQQTALERALSLYPRSAVELRDQRWALVAAVVSGKTRTQCMERYSALHKLALDRQWVDEQQELKGSDDDGGEGDEGEEEKEVEPEQDQYASSVRERGVELSLDKVVMSGVALIKCSRLALQCVCTRCSRSMDISLPATIEHELKCTNCDSPLAFRFRQELAHENNRVAGYLDLFGCAIRDYLPSDFWISCAECLEDHSCPGVHRGRALEANCRSCHQLMKMEFEDVLFHQMPIPALPMRGIVASSSRKPTAQTAEVPTDDPDVLHISMKGSAASKPQGRPKTKEESIAAILAAVIVEGNPLPENGACRHFRRSLRWYRFPCCGKAFPCDECHKTLSNPLHPPERATRIICGFCSREYPHGTKTCTCGRDFITIWSDHWEGGKGCREKNRMFRGENRKFQGMEKTKSAKITRVGQGAKEKLQAKQKQSSEDGK